MHVGVMFWPWGTPLEAIRLVKSLGADRGQLGMPGDAAIEPADALAWRTACSAENFRIETVFAAFTGESYADIATVERTVGFVPEPTRHSRMHRTLHLSDFARDLGAPAIACHIGFVPHNASDPRYIAMRDLVRRVCDCAASNDQTFALETGQEPASVLADFVRDVERPNLRINFDPANMILYGTGDPIAALDELAPWIATVHAKDGDWPASAGQLGIERRLGDGAVGMEQFVTKLRQIRYDGGLYVEREVEALDERLADMRHGITLLHQLVGATT